MPVLSAFAPAAPIAPTVTRYVGKCPICEGDFKLTTDAMPAVGRFGEGQKMVHHGYRRPGDGRGIVGDCYAVGHPAYEESCGVTREYYTIVARQRDMLDEYLARLQSGEVVELAEQSWRRGELPTVIKVGDSAWAHTLSAKISEVKHMISKLNRELDRLSKLIDTWVRMPLRTVEEFEAPARDARDAAKAQRKADYEARTQAKIDSYRKRLATAVRKHTASTIAEIFESAPRQLSDRGLTRAQAYAAIGGEAVFAAFGLDLVASCDRSTPNGEIISSMRYGEYTSGGYIPLAWPEALK